MKSITHLFYALCLLILIPKSTLAQIGAYNNIVFPYEPINSNGMRMGGATVALSNEVPIVNINPASLAYLDNTIILLSINQEFRQISYKKKNNISANSIDPQSHHTTLGYSAISFPIRALKKQWALGISFNGFQYPEFESSFVVDHRYSGDVASSSLGVGLRISSHFAIGLGWTKWFGRWKWSDFYKDNVNQTSPILAGKGVFDFKGNHFHFGATGQLNRLSIGVIFYSPLQLMEGKDIRLQWLGFNMYKTYQLEQKFNGAFNSGIAYQLSKHWTIGFGYGYQKSQIMNYKEKYELESESRNYKKLYKGSSKFSAGIEFAFDFRKARIPIYIAYSGTTLPKTSQYDYDSYQIILPSHQKALIQKLALGISYSKKSMDLHLVTNWTNSSNPFLVISNLVPPWS